MKKVFSILLVLLMILGLCACGESGAESSGETEGAKGLQIGYAKINVTPSYSVGISGYSNASERMSDGLMTYIYATCIAATEGDETILIYTVDNIAMEHNHAEQFRDLITKATGIPVVLMDANDIQRDQLGKSKDFPLTDEEIQDAMQDNPSGQGDELTPLILIRPL